MENLFKLDSEADNKRIDELAQQGFKSNDIKNVMANESFERSIAEKPFNDEEWLNTPSVVNFEQLRQVYAGNDEKLKLVDALEEIEVFKQEELKRRRLKSLTYLADKQDISEDEKKAVLWGVFDIMGAGKGETITDTLYKLYGTKNIDEGFERARAILGVLNSTPKDAEKYIGMSDEKLLETFNAEQNPNIKAFGFGGNAVELGVRKEFTADSEEFQTWKLEKTYGLNKAIIKTALQSKDPYVWRMALLANLSPEKSTIESIVNACTKKDEYGVESYDIKRIAEIVSLAQAMNPTRKGFIAKAGYAIWRDGLADAIGNGFNFLTGKSHGGVFARLYDTIEKGGGLKSLENEKNVQKYMNTLRGVYDATYSSFDNVASATGSWIDTIENPKEFLTELYTGQKRSYEFEKATRQLKQSVLSRYTSDSKLLDGVADGLGVISRMLPTLGVGYATRNMGLTGTMLTSSVMYADQTQMLIETLQDNNFSKADAWDIGVVGGIVLTALEKAQFDVFKGTPNIIKRGYEYLAGDATVRQILGKSIATGFKNRGKAFLQETITEIAQEFSEEMTIQIGSKLTGAEAKSFEQSMRDFAESIDDILCSMAFVSFVGGGFAGNVVKSENSIRNIATQVNELRKAKGKPFEELNVLAKQASNLIGENIKGNQLDSADFFMYNNPAISEEEKAKILEKYGENSEVAKSVFEETFAEYVKISDLQMSKLRRILASERDEKDIEHWSKPENKPLLRVKAEEMLNAFHKKFNSEAKTFFIKDLSEMDEESRLYFEKVARSNGMSVEQALSRTAGFHFKGRVCVMERALRTPIDALKVLKHEWTHYGAREIEHNPQYKAFIESVVASAGGLVRLQTAYKQLGLGAYLEQSKNMSLDEELMFLGEELLCRVAEKVELAEELTTEEKAVWDKIVDFLLDVVGGLPEENRDMYIAKAVNAIWSRDWEKGNPMQNTGERYRRSEMDFLHTADPVFDAEAQRQYDEIVAKYKDTEQWMKAPNGKPTNLTERQWVIVRTPNFKNWFNDWENDPQNASKVVDENGEPLVVYHGSVQTFTKFDKNKANLESDFGGGFYFTTKLADANANYFEGGSDFENKVSRRAEEIQNENEDLSYEEAKEMAYEELMGEPQLIGTFLNIRNPLYVGKKETRLFEYDISIDEYEDNEDAYYEHLDELMQDDIYKIENGLSDILSYEDIEKVKGVIFERLSDGVSIEEIRSGINELELTDEYGNFVNSEVLRIIAESLGYDGIIDSTVSKKFNMNLSEDTSHIIAFEPNQIKSATDNIGTFDSVNDDIRFSIVQDEKLLKELETGKTMKVYRAMQLIDGKLYPPMSAKINGEWREPSQLGKWEQAEENPNLKVKNGFFRLYKGNGKSIEAKYNPYFHTSSFPLNDQFSEAYKRPELVVVEVEIPVSELTSGYQAEGAKDKVGKLKWHSGSVTSKLGGRDVYLSRYVKPIRIVPEEEIARIVAERAKGKDIVFPSNVVTPQLKEALKKQGIKFDDKNEDIRFSIKPFNEQLTDFIAGRHPKDTPLYVGMTPPAVRVAIDEMRKRFPNEFIGKYATKDYSSTPILIYGSTIDEKRLKHDLNLNDLESLPELIADPLLILKSNTKEKSLLIITDLFDRNKNKISVALKLDLRIGSFICNSIRSIHGRQDGDISTQIKKGNLLYARDEESLSAFGILGNPPTYTYKTKQALSNTQSKKSSGSQGNFSFIGENDEIINNKRTIIDVAKDVDVKKELDSIADIEAYVKDVYKVEDKKLVELIAEHAMHIVNEASRQKVSVGEYATTYFRQLAFKDMRKLSEALDYEWVNTTLKAKTKAELSRLKEAKLSVDEALEDNELEDFGKNLFDAVALFNTPYEGENPVSQADLEAEIDAIGFAVDVWAEANNVPKTSHEYKRKLEATIKKQLRDLVNVLEYGIDRERAIARIEEISNSANPESVAKKAKALLVQIASYHAQEIERLDKKQREELEKKILQARKNFKTALVRNVEIRELKEKLKAQKEKLWDKIHFERKLFKHALLAFKHKYLKRNAVSRIKRTLARYAKHKSASVVQLKKPIETRVAVYFDFLKKIGALDWEQVVARVEEIEQKINNIAQRYESEGGSEINKADETQMLIIELDALKEFGGWEDWDYTAIRQMEKVVSGKLRESRTQIESDREELLSGCRIFADMLKEGLEASKPIKGDIRGGTLGVSLEGVSMFRHRLQNVFNHLKGDKGKSLRNLIRGFDRELSQASIEERRLNFKYTKELEDLLVSVFGKSVFGYTKEFSDFLKPKSEYKKFSVAENEINKAYLVNLYGAFQQVKMRESVVALVEKLKSKAEASMTEGEEVVDIKLMEVAEKLEKLGGMVGADENGNFPEITEEVAKLAKEIAESEKLFRLLEHNGVNERMFLKQFSFIPEIKAELNEKDLAILEGVKALYKARKPALNQSAKLTTALGMAIKENDPNYLPLFRDLAGGVSGVLVGGINLIPPSLIERKISFQPISEHATILSAYSKVALDDAHFIAFGNTTFKMLEVFNDVELNREMKAKMSPKAIASLRRQVGVAIRSSVENDPNSENSGWFSKVASVFATMKLGFNPISATKQFASFFAMMNEVGATKFWKHLGEAISDREFWVSFKEIYNSEDMAIREGTGIMPELKAILSDPNAKGNNFKAIAKKLRFFYLTGKADALTSALACAGEYHKMKKNYITEGGLSEESAKKLAMKRVMPMIEASQQSSLAMHSSAMERDGALGKLLMMFRKQPQQMLSYEVNAFKDWLKDPKDTNKQQRLVSVIITNHIIMPIVFNGIGLLGNLALGDELDDEDWWLAIYNGVFDVAGGYIFAQIAKSCMAVLLGISKFDINSDVLPVSSLSRTLYKLSSAISNFANGNNEKAKERLWGILKDINGATRVVIKLYENRISDKH